MNLNDMSHESVRVNFLTVADCRAAKYLALEITHFKVGMAINYLLQYFTGHL